MFFFLNLKILYGESASSYLFSQSLAASRCNLLRLALVLFYARLNSFWVNSFLCFFFVTEPPSRWDGRLQSLSSSPGWSSSSGARGTAAPPS